MNRRLFQFVALGCAAFLVILVIVVAIAMKRSRDNDSLESQIVYADGRTVAAREVDSIRDAADDRKDELDRKAENAIREIADAPDPASRNRASLRGLCDVDPGASPDCRLLDADSR